MAVRSLLIAAGVAVSQGVFAAANPPNSCPGGSVPYFDCDFAGGNKQCERGVNLGVLATPSGECSVPSPSNGCMLKGDANTKAWMWESSSNTRCCNCFPVKSPCPLGSVPYLECDFQGGSQKCVKGANTGAMAQENNGVCDVPSPNNQCLLEVNTNNYAWEFKSNQGGVTCCNCFVVESSGGSLLQAKQVRSHGRSLRRGHEEGDAASMLQLPLEEGDEDMDGELADAEQEEL